jgi:crotonobetainyl-CoA:carnitine CoA-transferase CaiB-like acyl-CoA transferase
VPSQLYRTKDGWIFFMCQTQRFWELLCQKIGRPELVDDPAFRDQAARHAHRDRLTVVLDEVLSAKTTAEWLDMLGGAVPCAPVYDVREALENPFLAERAGVQLLDHPDRPGFKLLASPIRTGAEVPARPAPKLGEHTDALLEELGYDPAEIEELRAQAVI